MLSQCNNYAGNKKIIIRRCIVESQTIHLTLSVGHVNSVVLNNVCHTNADHTCKWRWSEVLTTNSRPSDLGIQSSHHSSSLRVPNIDSLRKKVMYTRGHVISYQFYFNLVRYNVLRLSFTIPLP